MEVAEVVGMAGPEEGEGEAVPALAEGAGGPPSRVPPIHRRAHDGGACWESSAVSAAAEAGTASARHAGERGVEVETSSAGPSAAGEGRAEGATLSGGRERELAPLAGTSFAGNVHGRVAEEVTLSAELAGERGFGWGQTLSEAMGNEETACRRGRGTVSVRLEPALHSRTRNLGQVRRNSQETPVGT